MISASILDIRDPKDLETEYLSSLDIDLIHVDVMDGVFVENTTLDFQDYKNILIYANKPLDVHLMVSDVKKYVDDFVNLKPEYITFHFEAVSDVRSIINYIKNLNVKVGMSIKPTTSIDEIKDYLGFLDLVLVMSVEPGRGGQKFITTSTKKIDDLRAIRESLNYNFLIEVDGGINDETISMCGNADICVVGSFITHNDYKKAIESLRQNYNNRTI